VITTVPTHEALLPERSLIVLLLLLPVLLVLQIVTAWAGARSLRQRRRRWSRIRITLTAALPVPLLAAAFFAYLAGYDRLVRSIDGVRFDGAIGLVVGTVVLFCIGFAPAAVAGRKSTRSEDLAGIFE
jgi:purine-cytosine permease-like protein